MSTHVTGLSIAILASRRPIYLLSLVAKIHAFIHGKFKSQRQIRLAV